MHKTTQLFVLFFYNVFGDTMKIYVDLVLLLNFGFDFILLLSVSYLLRRMVSINRILLGAFVGSLSILFLFVNISSFALFLLKVVISIFMILVTFGYKDKVYFFKNIGFLYMSSIVLGGFLYFLNIQFSYKQQGLVFFHKGLSINFIFLIIFSPIIIYIYVRQGLNLKNNYSKYHNVKLYFDNKSISCVGYVDTGNKVIDPYLKRKIILINKEYNSKAHYIYVPINTVNSVGMIKCLKLEKLEIDGKEIKEKLLLGFIDKKINIDGVDCILPEMGG